MFHRLCLKVFPNSFNVIAYWCFTENNKHVSFWACSKASLPVTISPRFRTWDWPVYVFVQVEAAGPGTLSHLRYRLCLPHCPGPGEYLIQTSSSVRWEWMVPPLLWAGPAWSHKGNRGGGCFSIVSVQKSTPAEPQATVMIKLVLVLDFSVRNETLDRSLVKNRHLEAGGSWHEEVPATTSLAWPPSYLQSPSPSSSLGCYWRRGRLCVHIENTESGPHFTDEETKSPTCLTANSSLIGQRGLSHRVINNRSGIGAQLCRLSRY